MQKFAWSSCRGVERGGAASRLNAVATGCSCAPPALFYCPTAYSRTKRVGARCSSWCVRRTPAPVLPGRVINVSAPTLRHDRSPPMLRGCGDGAHQAGMRAQTTKVRSWKHRQQPSEELTRNPCEKQKRTKKRGTCYSVATGSRALTLFTYQRIIMLGWGIQNLTGTCFACGTA